MSYNEGQNVAAAQEDVRGPKLRELVAENRELIYSNMELVEKIGEVLLGTASDGKMDKYEGGPFIGEFDYQRAVLRRTNECLLYILNCLC